MAIEGLHITAHSTVSYRGGGCEAADEATRVSGTTLPYHLASPDWMKLATDGPQAAAETARGSTALNEKYAGETSFVTWTFSLSVGNKEPARQRDEACIHNSGNETEPSPRDFDSPL